MNESVKEIGSIDEQKGMMNEFVNENEE